LTRQLCIACEIFARPIYLTAAYSPFVIDIELIERGLHDQPEKLKESIQSHIDHAEGRGYDAILLGFGLCGNGTAGLQTRSIQLVVPCVHDCISLLLGDPQKYQDQFEQNPGTYWYSQDFLERKDSVEKFSSMGPVSDKELSKQYDKFLIKYGKENAEYLMEVMAGWQSHYNRAVFIDTEIYNDEVSQEILSLEAAQRGWAFEKLAGDLVLFRQLLNGEWTGTPSNFTVIPPDHSIEPSYDKSIFRCVQ
jgi:Protein of unknown function (DUF1638)